LEVNEMKSWQELILGILIFTGCRKAYNPPVIAAPDSYLVVEGYIDPGADSTIIKLSRTVDLLNNGSKNPLTGAIVTVESDQNNSYLLTEGVHGQYFSPGLNLDMTNKYRLRIKAAGKEYLSDFVGVLNSPPIDSVNYTIQNDGINIFVNTHDPNNHARYYRWDYIETWRFHSAYDSFFKSNGDTVLYRDIINDQIYTCWRSDTTKTIVIGTSAKLSKDVIANDPITFVPSTSYKLSTEYSILVKQYALTANAYAFWENLKKNTQQLGSIFDALPTQINGNIHCVSNPSVPVVGYLSVGKPSTNRLFIFNRNLPSWVVVPDIDTAACNFTGALYNYIAPGSNKLPVNQVNEFINYHKGARNPLIPIDAIFSAKISGLILGYTAAEPICVDCTLRGTRTQPSYWKYQ